MGRARRNTCGAEMRRCGIAEGCPGTRCAVYTKIRCAMAVEHGPQRNGAHMANEYRPRRAGASNAVRDVMEAVRPNIDAFVLELLQRRPFGTGDFFETRQGACRLLPPVNRMLAETAPRWTATLAPIVEGIAQTLMHAGASPRSTTAPRRLPTPLTQSNRSAGRAKVRRRKLETPVAPSPKMPAACLDCGTILGHSARRYCDACLPDIRQEQGTAFALAGPATLAERRAAGTDPAHGRDAGKSRGRRNAEHQAAVSEWEREAIEKPEPETFTREILPLLHDVPLSKMAKDTGLTEGYCSFVRRGLKVPHRRHWESLAKIGRET